MPGRMFLTRDIAAIATYLDAANDLDQPMPARRNIAPGQKVVVCDPNKSLHAMRWGIVPVGRKNARGRPVMETIINARSETVFGKTAFAGVRRCLVPCDGWYEWTGKARRKTAWRITRLNGDPVVFAGIFDVWTAPGGLELPQVATLTCEPSADVRDIHHRMGVILAPDQFSTWLRGDETEAQALCEPLTDGSLHVEQADDIDWNAP